MIDEDDNLKIIIIIFYFYKFAKEKTLD